MSARPSFLANIATILGGQAANVAIALLTEVCMARLLGPAPRGQVSVCLMAVWFGATVGGLGGDIPIVLWSAARKKPSHWLPSLAFWAIGGCCVAESLWWLLYSRFHLSLLQGVTRELALAVLFCIPVAILFNYMIAVLTGTERFRERATIAILENSATLGALLLLIWFYERSAASVMWGNWFGLSVSVLVALVFSGKIFRSGAWAAFVPTQEVRSGLLVGLRGQLGNVAALFTYRLDVFIVNSFLNPAHVGIYAVGVTVSESLWQLPQAVATALFPRTARTMQEDASSFTCLILRQVFLISFVSGAILAVLAPIAIPLVFGSRFAPAARVIWWLLPGTICLAVGKVAASDLAGRGKTTYSSIFSVVSLIATVALDLVLIPRMGIQGAALASSVAYFVNSALLVSALRHELKTNWQSLLIPSAEELWRYWRACSGFLSRHSQAKPSTTL